MKPFFTHACLLTAPAAALLTLLVGSLAYAAPGDPDATFGSGGNVITSFGSYADLGQAVTVQSDGRIIVAGSAGNGSDTDFALVRYTASGELDTSFNESGKLTTSIGNGDDAVNGVVVQSDGKIVVAGYAHNGTNYDIAVVRYLSSGSLDTSFNGTGKITTAIGTNHDFANSVALQSDGKIIVAGHSWNGSNYDAVVVRYASTGALDTGVTCE